MLGDYIKSPKLLVFSITMPSWYGPLNLPQDVGFYQFKALTGRHSKNKRRGILFGNGMITFTIFEETAVAYQGNHRISVIDLILGLTFCREFVFLRIWFNGRMTALIKLLGVLEGQGFVVYIRKLLFSCETTG